MVLLLTKIKKNLLICASISTLIYSSLVAGLMQQNVVQISSRGTIKFPLSPPALPPLPQHYDYIVYKSSDVYYVENAGGDIEYSSLSARNVLQWALDLSVGKKIIVKNAEYSIDDTLYFKSNSTVVLEDGCVIKQTAEDKPILVFDNVNNSYLSSTGTASIVGLGSGGFEKGMVLQFSNNNFICNLNISSVAEELLVIRQSIYNVFVNITGYKYALGIYASHGVVVDSSSVNYLVNFIIDGNNTGLSRCPLLLIGNYAPCTYNVVIGGEFKNSALDNGIYLCGYAYPVKNNYLTDFVVSGNKRGGHAGIKLRASSNNVITNFLVVNNYNGIEVGTDMTVENPVEPNSTGNYIKGTCENNDNVGLILYIDKAGRSIANNTFDLVLNNNGNNGVWIAVEFEQGRIERNVFYVSARNNRRNGIGFDITVSSGFIIRNYFKGILTNNGEYGIITQGQWSPQEYSVNFVDNRFDIILENNSLGDIYDRGVRTCVNKIGKEAAGAGNSPTASLWQTGDIVVNTDDNSLWIKDVDGLMKKINFTIIARFDVINNKIGLNFTTVQFIDQSFNLDGYITAWNWDFGDGTSSNQQNPIHVYRSIGQYNVTLTVTNSKGTIVSITMPINITGL